MLSRSQMHDNVLVRVQVGTYWVPCQSPESWTPSQVRAVNSSASRLVSASSNSANAVLVEETERCLTLWGKRSNISPVQPRCRRLIPGLTVRPWRSVGGFPWYLSVRPGKVQDPSSSEEMTRFDVVLPGRLSSKSTGEVVHRREFEFVAAWPNYGIRILWSCRNRRHRYRAPPCKAAPER